MTHEAVVREILERFNAGRLDDILELSHPGVEIVSQASRFTGEPYRGHDGLMRWFAETLDSFDEWSVSVDEVEETSRERVLAVGSLHMRGRESGANVDMPCAWVFDFQGELAIRMETFPNRVDEARALAAELAP
jgi:ketosteroid isomerase-like protein